MAEFPSVTVDLSEQLEFPGDSYPLTGKVDVATYTVGEKEYQLQDGIDYDVTSVTDPDGRRTHVSIAAVRRG